MIRLVYLTALLATCWTVTNCAQESTRQIIATHIFDGVHFADWGGIWGQGEMRQIGKASGLGA